MSLIYRFAMLCIILLPVGAYAATYTMASNSRPPCSTSWSVSGTTYTCNGDGRVTLNNNDVISVSAGSITLVAANGFQLGTNVTLGRNSNRVNLQATYGSVVVAANSVIWGNVQTSSGAVGLISSTIHGNVQTDAAYNHNGGAVNGNINATNGVVLTDVTVSGTVTANSDVSLTGGSIAGRVTSSSNKVTATNSTLQNGVSGSSGIQISGGTLSGGLESVCNNIVLTNATILAGDIKTSPQLGYGCAADRVEIIGGNITANIVGGANNVIVRDGAEFNGNIQARFNVLLAGSTVFGNISGESGYALQEAKLVNSAVYGSVTVGTAWQRIVGEGNSAIYGQCTYGTVTPATLCSQSSEQCFIDNFQRDILGDNWAVTNKSGSFGNPRIVNGRLRITNNSANAATATTLQRLFPSEGNLVTLEYDFYAYGGNGADGMVVVFSDGNVTPEPGAFGGSLGYAQKGSGTDCPNCPGFAGGWLGLGLDTFGNYSNPTEGRLGGAGFRQNAIALRGSGVGQMGYRYISGTNSLSPAVRTGNSATAHRYRITIDSRNPAHSWVTIARNTGNGFVTIIGPVDVLTSAGQAAVPQDLLLTLTGSTGGSNDIHEIDNVQVCAVRMDPIRRGINHFRILHSGTGLTCAAEPVRVLACANNDCSERFAGAVSLTMSPAAGWVGGAGYNQSGPTFNASGGQFDLALRSSNAGSIDVKIDGSTPTAQNSTRCFRNGVEGSCQLTFTDIGIQLDGDSTDDAKSAIPTQITGKPSNVGHNGKQQRLRVIRTNSTTGVCEAAVRGKTLDVQFRYNLPVAANGLADNKITINSSNNQQVLTTADTTRTLPLEFDNQGNGYFVITSQDAGSYTLRADMNVPVTAPDGSELTASLARSDTSLPFIVRPLALYAHANGNNGAVSAAGPAFRAAGNNFNLLLQAVSWQAGIDTNNDGQWDQCQLQDLTAPTVSPRLPAWSLAQQQPGLRVPAAADGGVAGTLKYDDSLNFSAGSSISNAARVNYSEVGIVQFDKTASFQGQSVQVCSGYIGRFYPANFELSNSSLTPGCDSFSYMQQPFAAGFTLTARNIQNQKTENYTAAFASATALLQAENNNNGIPLTGRLAGTVSPTWDRGMLSYLAPALRFKREIPPKEDGPYLQLAIAVQALDKDGVPIADRDTNVSTSTDCKAANNCTAKQLAVTDIRYGRMVLKNAYGPEDENLPLSLNAEYWDGSRFMISTQDSCSLINTSNLTTTGNFGVTAVAVASKLRQGQTPRQSFVLRAPNSIGTLNGEYVVPAWLQYNWSGKLSGCSVNPDDPTTPNCYNENPTAEFMFGRFRGNPRQIFWRELFR
jgi:hypothetical protein